MKNFKKNSGLSALQLVLIIAGAIIVAAGVLFVVLQICKKKCNKKAIDSCCCESEFDELDEWDIDEDILSELDFDDEELCCCDDCAECSADDISDDKAADAE